jgi:DNA-binding NtrC family response regulator
MSGDLQHDEPEANAVTAGEAVHVIRILILEDETLGAELAQRLLVRAGLSFTAIVVGTRASFTEQLAAFRPEIILSDYRLPGFSGQEAFRIAQEGYPDIPFIFWSGVLGDEAAVELIKQGATDYVLKDRPARLPSVIVRALAEAERQVRLTQLKDQLRQAQRRTAEPLP